MTRKTHSESRLRAIDPIVRYFSYQQADYEYRNGKLGKS